MRFLSDERTATYCSLINDFDMSTDNLELITCDRCQRRYNIEVYHRHRNANQCIKRNQSRLPFQSIKQRSIQIGDQTFSIQALEKNVERKNQPVPLNNNKLKQSHDRLQRFLPSNNRRRALEQAKQLLERRTKYQPPWIQKRSSSIKSHSSKMDAPYKMVDQSTQKSHSNERLSPSRIKFPTDNQSIKLNNSKSSFSKNDKSTFVTINRFRHHQQPILTHSPNKTRACQVIATTSKTLQSRMHAMDQTFSHEPLNSACRSIRKANTWTRSSKQSSNHDDGISPIHIPTFDGSSTDRITLPSNQNYDDDDDDDDEFERYSPTPTPRYIEQQTIQRPSTYKKTKRPDRQTYETLIQPCRKETQSIFHLPPINPKPPSRPWR